MEVLASKKQDGQSRDVSIVTARIPAEIKRQGNAILKRIGSSPTELINSAYQYVLENEDLPTEHVAVKPGRKELSPNQKDKLKRRARKMLVKPGGDVLNGRPLKDVLAEMRYADYEALS